MYRSVSLEEISDGNLYDSNQLARADCGGCEGCSACCRGMGSSVLLDPLDAHRLSAHLSLSFEELLESKIELNPCDGLILPNLNMNGKDESCAFLDSSGRCSVHAFRPGICRLFPLGRHYENRTFRYFLQSRECKKEKRSKVKIRRWIDTPNVKTYETFVSDWHYFLKDLGELPDTKNSQAARTLLLDLLKTFYLIPYDASRDFYPQFYERLREAQKRWLRDT